MSNGVEVNGNSRKCPTHVEYKAVTDCPKVLEPDFVYPDLPSRCTWDRNSKCELTPHTKRPL